MIDPTAPRAVDPHRLKPPSAPKRVVAPPLAPATAPKRVVALPLAPATAPAVEPTAPLVSIVIPVWNASQTLALLLESIRQQTYSHIEVIAVDDASRDDSALILQRYGVKVLRNERNLGMTRTRNAAARQAKGDYVLFLDSDMELTPEVVKTALAACEREGYDAVAIPERSKGQNFWAKCRGLDKRMVDDDSWRRASRFFRREVLETIGEHDERLIAAEDFDFDMRMREAGFRFTQIPQWLYHHEVATLGQMIRKTFRYGQTAPAYFAKRPWTAAKQFFFIRPAYLRNFSLFLRHPIVGAGLVFLKIAQYTAGVAGVAVIFLKSLWPAAYSETIEARWTGRMERSVELCGNLKEKVVLNVGARNGWLEEAVLRAGARGVTGIDIDGPGLRGAHRMVPGARFFQASALQLPFADSTFDVVTLFEVLEHLPPSTEAHALKELRRVLKPTGLLIGSTPYRHWLSIALDAAWWFKKHRHYSNGQLKGILSHTQFEIREMSRAGGLTELLTANFLYLFKIFGREIPLKNWLELLRAREYRSRNPGIATLFFQAEKTF